ncbi:hypothetical protein Q7404_06920 [Glaesserella parasuis]|nr:hypothetical protein [Glaesserella parasuis]
MIDIQGELLAIETEWDSQYISIADLLYYLKNGNENIDYKDVATVLLKKLSNLNVDLIDLYEECPEVVYEEDPRLYFTVTYGICAYRRGDDNSAISLVGKRDNLFFDFLTCIKNSKLSLEHIKLSLDEWDFEQVNAKDVFIEVGKIEKGLNITIPQDREPYNGIMGVFQDFKNGVYKQRELDLLREENQKLKSRIEELNKNPNSSQQTNRIAELEQQLEELKQKLAQATQPPTEEEKQNRISQPQRDIFTLLVMNNYQNYQSRNALFEAINADMKAKGIRASDIKYPTLDNLIDDNLRINKISPFPPKQK